MRIDIASLLCALMINVVTIAVALPAVMGRVNAAARRAQWSMALQAAGWALLLSSGLVDGGGLVDRVLSSLSMLCLGGSLALLGTAFDLWCGRAADDRVPVAITALLVLGYVAGFSSYPFRVGWANGLLALQTAVVFFAVARRPVLQVGRWRWPLAAALVAHAVITAWRGVLGAFFTASYPSFLAPHPVNYAAAMVSNVAALLALLAILLAHRDEAARELERLATIDGLTGVLNRRAWLARAGAELSASLRHGRPLAVLMIDLDHFKQINDARGHEAGDRALRAMAGALLGAVRTGDVIGRYGGEEFCVMMGHADAAAARVFDRRLRERLAAATGELGFAVDYSAGIALSTGAGETLEALLRRADSTLYLAKAAGRARTLDEPGLQLHAA